jgi:hypothetical protein
MPRTTQNLQITEDTSWERLWANEAGAALRIIKPWAALILVFLAGLGLHLWLGRPAYLAWAAVGLTLSGTGLTVFTWNVSRLVTAGRAHSSATMAAVALWLVIVTITGPFKVATLFLLLVGGATVALTWNLRGHARRHQAAAGEATPSGRLSAWFADAARQAGITGATLQVREIEPTRAVAKASLSGGETATQLQSRARHIESAMKFPPGALTIAEDLDRADQADVTLSDPRLIRSPIPWPGPSRPGQSIARPVRPGIWQDGRPVDQVLTGYHQHIMGSSGAGKSIGACWNYSAEIITRYDAALIAADITKGSQTWGPLEPALHRVAYKRDEVRDLFNTVHKLIPVRTTWLADHGLTKWVEGCGLTYWFLWPEETPDIYDCLTSKEQEHWESDVKALRSGGGTWEVSLQRSDWSQIPTIVRGQMASMCFGLYKSSDERFGLSEKQQEMGCSPSSWGTDQPGTAYLHYPGCPHDRIAMPMRTFSWGSDEESVPAMAAYAAQYPASARPVDEITAILIGGQPAPARPAGGAHARPVAVLTRPASSLASQEDTDTYDEEEETEPSVLDEYLTTEDPNPGLETGLRDPLNDDIEGQPDDEPFEFDTAEPIDDPAEARAIFAKFLDDLRAAGKTDIAAKDFAPLYRPGMGRAWIHARLSELVGEGQLTHDREHRTYQFTAPPKDEAA